jgi:P27 family predicted phage terminase small subunit
MYDQYSRVQKVVKKSLVVRGSTGQIRTNPLAEHALKLETQILRLENELGLTPMARQRLGIAVGEAANSLASINDLLNASEDPANDPRILELLEEE